jgi:Holliday junction resolvase RusA-like endonuclease
VTLVDFFVHGTPRPQGSKKASWNSRARRYAAGKVVGRGKVVMRESSEGLKPWRAIVAGLAAVNRPRLAPKGVPVSLVLEFVFERPASHFKRGKLREDAPRFVTRRPDIDKLERAILDALTGVVWFDDSQVAIVEKQKRYGEKSGVRVVASNAEETL